MSKKKQFYLWVKRQGKKQIFLTNRSFETADDALDYYQYTYPQNEYGISETMNPKRSDDE
jgi:hypothetical protein